MIYSFLLHVSQLFPQLGCSILWKLSIAFFLSNFHVSNPKNIPIVNQLAYRKVYQTTFDNLNEFLTPHYLLIRCLPGCLGLQSNADHSCYCTSVDCPYIYICKGNLFKRQNCCVPANRPLLQNLILEMDTIDAVQDATCETHYLLTPQPIPFEYLGHILIFRTQDRADIGNFQNKE